MQGLRRHQNYQDPFNPTATVEFSVPNDSNVPLNIDNSIGREVTTLFSGPAQAEKLNDDTFDPRRLSSDVHFLRVEFVGKQL